MDLYLQVKEDLEKALNNLGQVGLEKLIEYTKMKNMALSIEKTLKHIKNKSKIRIIGDYDADGIMATVIMMSFFKDHPNLPTIDYFIPNRFIHGYGISPLIVEEAKNDGIELIITVDNGISAIAAIDKANELGIDIIITDHHTAPKILPNIDTIVNPKIDNTLESNELSGATVAWIFCYALNEALPKQIKMTNYLDLAAITILSDVIRLEHVNRTILEFGFAKIKENKREVYKKIFSKTHRDQMNSGNISFNLVPKINATGRLADANLGVELFLNDDIDHILDEVTRLNEERKELTSDQVNLVMEQAAEQNEKYNIIIVTHETFHEGIVGIIASNIVEMFNKPAIVLAQHGDDLKGSARSLGNISIYELLNNNSHLLLKFGGHAGAAGLGMKAENLDILRENISNEMSEKFSPEDYENKIYAYKTNAITALDLNMATLLHSFEPYGSMFQRPKFIIKAKIIEITKVFPNGNHYKTIVRDKLFGKREVMFFKFHGDLNEYVGKELELLIDVSLNFFNGKKDASLSATIIK